MSGELRATQDWAHVEPVETKPKKRRRRKPPPQTTLGVLVYGLRRFVFYGAVISGGVALAAYLVSTFACRSCSSASGCSCSGSARPSKPSSSD